VIPDERMAEIRAAAGIDHDHGTFTQFLALALREILTERDELASERARYRIAWRGARTRARSSACGADIYAKRARELQDALIGTMTGDFFDLLAALTAESCETDAYGNCATHGVLVLEPGGQCPHVIVRTFLALVWPSGQPSGSAT